MPSASNSEQGRNAKGARLSSIVTFPPIAPTAAIQGFSPGWRKRLRHNLCLSAKITYQGTGVWNERTHNRTRLRTICGNLGATRCHDPCSVAPFPKLTIPSCSVARTTTAAIYRWRRDMALEIELGRDACALRQRRPRSWRPQSSRRWQQDDPVADRGSGGDLTRQPFVR